MSAATQPLDAGQHVLRLSEEMIAKGSKSFAAAARLFAPDTRADAVMLYAWCRHADDVIDGQVLGHSRRADRDSEQAERLAELRARTQAALDGETCDDPVFDALRQVVASNRIPHRHPQELITGFTMDVDKRIYRTCEDTLDYCYHVAGVVGVMMAMIMGMRDEAVLDRASDLGVAFQLTNIARDVIDDARADRVYLPSEWLEEAGLDSVDPDNRAQWPMLHALALRLLDEAEPYYASAFAGVSALPFRSAWAIAAARRVYRDIGRVLRDGGPQCWEKRPSTTVARKTALMALSMGDVMATRLQSPQNGPARTGLYQRPL